MEHPAGVAGMPKAAGCADRLAAWLAKHDDMPGAAFLAAMVPFAVKQFGFDAGRVRARARRLDHRRQLPGPRSHARPQREDHPRVPDVGDVREAQAEGQVRPLRGRGRHGRHVLPLQVAEGEPAAEARRHDRARHADLHAVPRDDRTSRTTRSRWCTSRRPRRTASSSRTRSSRSSKTRRSRRSSWSTRATRRAWRSARRRSRRSSSS